jgi:hypothetical protein
VGHDAILVEGASPSSENHLTVIERVSIVNAQTGIHLKATSKPTIRGAFVLNFKQHGILVENVPYPDHGDGLIEGSWIATRGANVGFAGIRQKSSGGLKLQGNKIVGRMDFGVLLEPTQLTGVLIIDGNSIEAHGEVSNQGLGALSGRNITLRRTVYNPKPASPASGDQFQQVIISNNHLGFAQIALEVYDSVPPTPPAPWLSSLVLMGNTLLTTNVGFALHEVDGVFISGNIFDNTAIYATPSAGIYLGPTKPPTNVKIAGNAFLSVTTHIANPHLATLCPPATCN